MKQATPPLLVNATEWLRQHRAINLLLVLIYFLFIVFMHHPLVLLSVHVEQLLGIGHYDTVVAVILYFCWPLPCG
ncbi:MAG: hypothetical protein IPH78_14055 [Bacteroidetes bacterium]|nr:hypothetical protein [Bacteroidota bacterium]